MADIIQIRRDTAANWTSTNPTLAQGEMGYETDTGKLKFGDGSTAWTSLSYYSAGTAFLSDTNPVISEGTITEDATTTIYVSGSLFDPYVIDPSLGSIQTHVVSGVTSYYDDGLSLGQAVTLHITLSGSPSIIWPTMTWVNNGGSAPTLASLTIVSLWKAYDSSDTATLYGALVGDGS